MKQEISALMDSELFEDDADSLLDRIKPDSTSRHDWEMYHLIGDVLRQPEHMNCSYTPCDLSAKVRKIIQDESIILAKSGFAVRQKARAFALSVAASLLAVGVVAWMSLQISPELSPQIAMRQASGHQVNLPIQSNSSDYLMAHQEFSPSTEMNGGASYIHTVSYGSDAK